MFALGTGPAALPVIARTGLAPGAGFLGALTIPDASAVESSAAGSPIGTILGLADGSAVALVDSAGGRFALAGQTLVRGAAPLDFESASEHQVTLRETLSGAANSPRDSIVTVAVVNAFEQPALGALSLTPTSLTQGTYAAVSIVGATAGSLLEGNLPPGLVLDSAARTVSGTPTTVDPAAAWTLTETLGDSPNSPRTSSGTLAVAAAVSAPVPTIAPTVSGTGRNTGAVLTATPGLWDNAPTGYAYQWLRNGAAIGGATGSSYTLTTADSMASLSVIVTASNAGGTGASLPSEPFVAALAYTVLADFETLGSAASTTGALSLSTGSRKVLGTAGLRMVASGANIASGGITGGPPVAFDFASRKRYVLMTDLGSAQEKASLTVKPKFTTGSSTYGYYPGAVAGLSVPSASISYLHRGKAWQGRATKHLRIANSSGARLDALGPVSATTAFDHVAQGNTAYDADYVIDALLAIDDSYRPAVILTFDDAPDTQYTNARPGLNANALKGTFYVPTGLINGATRLTSAQLTTLAGEGHGMSLDSAANDEPGIIHASPAAWLAALDAMKATLTGWVGNSAAVVQDMRQLCYSYGRVGLAPEVSASFTTNGTTTVPTAANYGYQYLTVGQRIFGPNVPSGCTVTGISSPNTITTSHAIPAQTATLVFGGWKRNLTVTANGGDTVTVAAGVTDSVYAGMAVTSGVGCTGRRVLATTATTIQFDGAIPPSVTRMCLGDIDHPWWWTKVHDALIAGGYQSARMVGSSTYAGPFTGFGLDPRVAMGWPAMSTATLAATDLARLDHAIEEGVDCVFYFHGIADAADFATFCAGVKARIDAGLVRNLTMGKLMAEIAARAGP